MQALQFSIVKRHSLSQVGETDLLYAINTSFTQMGLSQELTAASLK